jgi:hypothetical protein
LAESTSKPIALAGSVSSADGKYSIGGYSMSTQSTTVPGVMRLVGTTGLGVGLGPSVAVAASVGDAVAAGVGDAPPVQALATRASTTARDDRVAALRFTVRPPHRRCGLQRARRHGSPVRTPANVRH